ncbi:unnamed protein product [Caenorhabditis sp. 36 PRJEB53466]|nr:unnamed protein product [Caenorhabditis sp. 36 PRJEB53466]
MSIANKNDQANQVEEDGMKTAASSADKNHHHLPDEKWTPYLFFCISSIALASFQDGFQIGCINAPGPLIIEWIKQSHFDLFGETLSKYKADFIWSVAVSMFSVGGMFGSLSSGFLADRIGRKRTLFHNNILALLAATCLSAAKFVNFYPMIVLGRFLVGLNCGITSGLVPMYLTELAPANLRGKSGSFHQLNISVAIVLSQALGLPFIFGSPEGWPWIFSCVAIPTFLQLSTIPFCAESPKYLISKLNDREGARQALIKLRNHDKVEEELEHMVQEAMEAAETHEPGYLTLFKGENQWPMIVSILMMFSQQFSGISAVTFYSTLIFKRNGLSGNDPLYATLGFGCVKLVATVFCLFLIDHPKFGRKRLHIGGLSGMCISSILIVITLTLSNAGYQWASYINILFILSFVVAFAFGPGPIPWFFTSELFDSASRGRAAAVSASSNWIANWLVGLTFLPINNVIHQFAFFMFTFFTFIFIIFTWKFVPETKGKSPTAIRKELTVMRKRVC